MESHKNNQFYKLRKDLLGDGLKYSPEQLIEKINGYIDYCQDNPLIEVDYRGRDLDKIELPKMRAMSIIGCCVHIGIASNTWRNWKKREEYLHILKNAEDIFFTQKFEGAAAGMLNQGIISRDLGLADKKIIEAPELPKLQGVFTIV